MVGIGASHLEAFDGLLWYLEVRNWAFKQIADCPIGALPFDMRLHNDLYFSNLLSAVDHVRDHLLDNDSSRCAFTSRLENGFDDTEDYYYVRELRSAIIHRGLASVATGHADGTKVFALCPTAIQDRRRKKSYNCPFKYTVELAAHCNITSNAALALELDRLGLFDPVQHVVSEEDVRAAIGASAAVPDWAKAMAGQALERMDFPEAAAELAATRVERMRSLLGQPQGAG